MIVLIMENVVMVFVCVIMAGLVKIVLCTIVKRLALIMENVKKDGAYVKKDSEEKIALKDIL